MSTEGGDRQANGGTGAKLDDAPLWELLEKAWSSFPEDVQAARRAMSQRRAPGVEPDEATFLLVDRALRPLLDVLKELVSTATSEEITLLDRIVERKLYDVDRQDVHAIVDGSDDGFLYARGFIVALGKEYYEAVLSNPEGVAIEDACHESLCYFFSHLHEERFGDWPTKNPEGISRETCSNRAGWSRN